MRFIDEFRDPAVTSQLVAAIRVKADHPVNFMEVCGTHTVAIFKHGIRQLIPENITLLSGPGCPVCVTPNTDIDKAIALVSNGTVTLATFGDMMRVPGSDLSLQQAKADGADVRIVYSAMDAIKIAQDNPQKPVIFFGVGFETTSPTIAGVILEAERLGIGNFFLLPAHKIIPPAMKALLDSKEVHIDGFICPGHVSTIIGSEPYQFIPQKYHVPCVITGFEPLDILQAINMLLEQNNRQRPSVEIQYRRAVRPEGNTVALKYLSQVFEVADASWRGIGVIPNSGLKLNIHYQHFDVERNFSIKVKTAKEIEDCLCGDILRGVATPPKCRYFAKACTPEHPIGPCMVSTEGTCAAWYQYHEISRIPIQTADQ